MFFKIGWDITIGEYKLGFLESAEIHRSVDLLADTAMIKIPATIANKAIKVDNENFIEGKIKRGDKITIKIGYNDSGLNASDAAEFEGYLLNINTDDGSIVINCEDDLFLMRKKVDDKQFKQVSLKTIADYLISNLGIDMVSDCSGYDDAMYYDKFIIKDAQAYDVLKKLQDETKGNIYIKKNTDGVPVLHIHPPYIENHGYVNYSFQQNIEKSDLKYKSKEDRKVQITIKINGKDGKVSEAKYGDPGGENYTVDGYGMSKDALMTRAQNEYKMRAFDGYEGSITTWLIPYVEPGYSATITDDDYEYKDGTYYVTAVTTSIDGSSGIARKVQLGIKLVANG